MAHSVQRLATGWTVPLSNPGGGKRFIISNHTGLEAHPASCKWAPELFLGGVEWPGSRMGVVFLSVPVMPYGVTFTFTSTQI